MSCPVAIAVQGVFVRRRPLCAMPCPRACAVIVPLLALARADAAAGPLMQALAREFPNASKWALAGALRSALQVEGVPLSEAACERDYGAPCPLGWLDAGNGGTCSPPLGYDGPCASIDVRGSSAFGKMRAAAECEAVFPCSAGCTADYSKLCPGEWLEAEEGPCVAPATYDGPCVGSRDFSHMGTHGKAAFAAVCGVQWPCRRPSSSGVGASRDCAVDFAASCPEARSMRRGFALRLPIMRATAPSPAAWAITRRQRRVRLHRRAAPLGPARLEGESFGTDDRAHHRRAVVLLRLCIG